MAEEDHRHSVAGVLWGVFCHIPSLRSSAAVNEGQDSQTWGPTDLLKAVRSDDLEALSRLLLVGPEGIEPSTFGLKARCSAN